MKLSLCWVNLDMMSQDLAEIILLQIILAAFSFINGFTHKQRCLSSSSKGSCWQTLRLASSKKNTVIFNIYNFITHDVPSREKMEPVGGVEGDVRYRCLCSARHLNKTVDNTIYLAGTTQGKVTLQREEWHHEQSEREEETKARPYSQNSCSCPHYILLIPGFVPRNRQRWRDCEMRNCWMSLWVHK